MSFETKAEPCPLCQSSARVTYVVHPEQMQRGPIKVVCPNRDCANFHPHALTEDANQAAARILREVTREVIED